MEKKNGGISTGTSLILVIFVVMCLVTFSVLAYISAVSDRNLSIQAAERTKEYYAACNKAEETLMQCKQNKLIEEQYLIETEENNIDNNIENNKVISFTEDIGDKHYLKVEAIVTEDGDYTITEWTTNIKENYNKREE